MVRYIFIVSLLLLMTASCADRGALRALDSVESYITEEPDRALSALDSLSQAGIKGKEANARYALLYSMWAASDIMHRISEAQSSAR